MPCARAGHSASVYRDSDGEYMVIFGGKDHVFEKLDDLWMFTFKTGKWQKLEHKSPGPLGRSGHSSTCKDDFFMVFGGIFEITKELNDTYVYDMRQRDWVTLGDVE